MGTDDIVKARAAKALWELRSTQDGVSFDEIRHVPCLILIGEPGMGKSHFVQREEQRLSTYLKNSADESILQNLAGSGSVDEVQRRLFGTETYRGWKTGVHWLALFVDSVDQAGVSAEYVVTAIANELADADVSRLHLRLVCRDHDWSLTLANTLEHVWRRHLDTEASVRVYQLAPLDLNDIRLAADANSNSIKDPDQFLRDIETADALALATVPITLEMLLMEPEHLTSSRTELYERGLRHLWKRTEGTAELSHSELEKRFEMASRTAAVMMLSHKHSVDVEAADVHESSSTLTVKDLLLDVASEREECLIRAILVTPLFQGTDKRAWAHQSFAEYLAAHCLSNENIPVKEILDMTVAQDEKFASHLRDTLRWLIEMRTDVLSQVIKRQPMLVLTTDVSHLNEKNFRKLFTTILSLPDPYVYSHETWNLRKFQASHPSAKSVLLPYLADKERSQYLRRFVLRLMERLDIRDIDDELLQIALDENEDQVLRHWAARRICDVGSDESKLRLKPYIHGKDDDSKDELKGDALQALWPDQLTADELFHALSPPKRGNYLGSYKMFLIEGSVVDDLQAVDFPVALNWVAAQPSHHEMSFSMGDLPGKIMRKAWENIHCEGVMEAFAETAVAMMSRFDGLFSQSPNSYPPNKELDEFEKDFIKEADKRRELALPSLKHMLHRDMRPFRLIHCWPPLVVADDLDWLLGLLYSEMNGARRVQLAQLVASLFPQLRAQDTTLSERYRNIDKVYDASNRHPELKQLTRHYFISKLDDPGVVSDRNHFRQRKEIDEKIARQRAEARPFERLEEALDRIEAGETWQWIYVCAALTSIPGDTQNTWGFQPDLTDYPTWQSCNDETQERVLSAALSYISNQDAVSTDDSSDDWYDTCRIPHVEFYGYSAIFLILKADANALSQLPADRWERWSKVAVWYPYVHIIENDGRKDYYLETRSLQKDLIRKLHAGAPHALIDNLCSLIIAEDSRGHSAWQELDRVEHLWDSKLENKLLDMIRESNLSPRGQRSILDSLLAKKSAVAIRIAEALISRSYTNQNEKDLAVEFAASLMASGVNYDWSLIWNLLQNDDDIGCAIVEKVAEEDWYIARFANKLSAPELVDLFSWVEERYPTSEDPEIDGSHVVTTREQVGRWRNGIITELRKRNSVEALDGIRRILRRFPKLEWLNFVRLDLEKAVEGTEWEPASPKNITNWLNSYQRPRLSAVEHAKRFFKKHRKTILTVVAITFPVTVSLFLPEIRRSLGLESTASVESTDTSYSTELLEESTYSNPATVAATVALQTASDTPAPMQGAVTRKSRLDATPRPNTPARTE